MMPPRAFISILTGHLVLMWEDGQRSEMRKNTDHKKKPKVRRAGLGQAVM